MNNKSIIFYVLFLLILLIFNSVFIFKNCKKNIDHQLIILQICFGLSCLVGFVFLLYINNYIDNNINIFGIIVKKNLIPMGSK